MFERPLEEIQTVKLKRKAIGKTKQSIFFLSLLGTAGIFQRYFYVTLALHLKTKFTCRPIVFL